MPESKGFLRKLEKRTARFFALVNWAGLDYIPKPRYARQLIRGLVNKHDQHEAYDLHKLINNRRREDILDILSMSKKNRRREIKKLRRA